MKVLCDTFCIVTYLLHPPSVRCNTACCACGAMYVPVIARSDTEPDQHMNKKTNEYTTKLKCCT